MSPLVRILHIPCVPQRVFQAAGTQLPSRKLGGSKVKTALWITIQLKLFEHFHLSEFPWKHQRNLKAQSTTKNNCDLMELIQDPTDPYTYDSLL